MRWIKHDKQTGKIGRGDAIPPDGGDLYMVDEQGSMALVGGVLYINGKISANGTHTAKFKDKDLEFNVVDGKAEKVKKNA